ncbi:SMC-Scp complex subunit ScpB [Micromonospora sp. DT229]|uniref:SMC-Scp complex subunit ScpB n=1 Tax=Micromonospora sp. DT229 TaxID=3393430 RepID=UPI003CEFADC1
MTHEERGDSLADQAAAWIPPWQRPAPPVEAAAPDRDPEVPRQGPSHALTAPSTPAQADVPDDADVVGAAPDDAGAAGAAAGETGVVGAVTAGGTAGAAVVRRQRSGRTRPAPEPAPVLDDTELRGALEAILLVVDEPVSELTLAQVLEQPPARIGPMLDEIAAGYTAAGHGFDLRRAAGGWRLYTRPEYATYVERFVLDGQSVRITQAALETLAVVAYKQPVTRSRISAIRGVNCDGVIRTLVSRGLIEECGTESDSGAFLYRTTTMFLEKLGLNSLDDLPPLAPFLPDDVEELADASR